MSTTTNWPPIIHAALARPSGARFYRCALQVNPFEYVKRHAKPTTFADEAAYTTAILDALQEQGIEVIAVADHYRVKTAAALIKAAEARGIHVFRGFEAVSKDGVHVLCLFDPAEDITKVDRFIGDCGVHDEDAASPTGTKDFDELVVACTENWNGICIAAHVCSSGGLLNTLHGQTAMQAWKHKHLHSCALPGSSDDAPSAKRDIIKNRNPDYMRDRSIAVVNAQDVSDPSDAKEPGEAPSAVHFRDTQRKHPRARRRGVDCRPHAV